MDYITKLVLDCNRDRQLLGMLDIKNIANYIIEKRNYPVKKVLIARKWEPKEKINGGNFVCPALYNKEDKNLYFFRDGLIDFVCKHGNEFKSEYNPEGTIFDAFNFWILICIFHELNHARQEKILNSSNSSLEKKLIGPFTNLCFGDEQYRNNYSNMLNEVNSENVGIVSANYIFSRLPKNFLTNHDRKCYQLQTLKSILYANYEVVPKYETIVSPAERIVEAFDDETLAKMNLTIEKYSELISNTDNLTLYKKLMLGLPISYSEYGYANLLIDELTNGIDINAIKKLQKRLY